jgi:hypothetical protein
MPQVALLNTVIKKDPVEALVRQYLQEKAEHIWVLKQVHLLHLLKPQSLLYSIFV